jgi:hypothetical protein
MKMRWFSGVVGWVLVVGNAFGMEDASKILLDGATLCSRPNNPIVNGLGAVVGDYFTNLDLRPDGTVTASMVSDPSVYNTAIKAPIRIVGEIQFKKGYRSVPNQPGDQLFCELQVKKFIEE